MFLLDCVREIAFYSSVNEFEIRVLHLSSSENRLADLLSRWHLDDKNATKFFAESGLSSENEILIGEEEFQINNKW